jgi:hypothetical protein
MDQLLLLVSIVLAFLLVSTKQGKQLVSSVSKSVSSISSQKGRVGFPTGLALLLVIFALVCLTRNRLIEGMNHGMPSPNMTLQGYCQSGMANPTLSTQDLCESMHSHEDPTQKENDYSRCLFNPPIPSEKCLQPSPSQDYIRDLWLDLFNYHSDPENPPWPTGCPSIGTYERANRPHSLDVIGDCMPYLNSN